MAKRADLRVSRAELGESGSVDLGVFARIGFPAKAWGWNLVDMAEEERRERGRRRESVWRERDLVREWKGGVERKRSIWDFRFQLSVEFSTKEIGR